jgi:D-glucosaminate-6-phosphate ammonia-lyase
MDPTQLYRDLGCTPVINASGNQTVLGGSRISPAVQEAMIAANRHYVEMKELFLHTGKTIAQLVGAEAAFVTPGCGAALALSAAACMSGDDPAKMEQLPNTEGIANDFLFQARQHYHYERCLTIFGGNLVMVGDSNGTAADQLEAAIGENTAGIHFFASGDEDPSILDLEAVVKVADRHGIPVIVDAAYQVYPLDRFAYYTQSGASLIGFGAKYFGACNSTGILAGKKDLVEAAFMHSFIGFETSDYETLGRPLKLDRQEIVAVTVGLQEWLGLDHNARIAQHWVKADKITNALSDIPHIKMERHVEDNSLSNGVILSLDEKALGKTAAAVINALKAGDPSIWTKGERHRIRIAVAHLIEDEIEIVIERLRQLLLG